MTETQNTLVFEFFPIYRQSFIFRLHKAKLRKHYSNLAHLSFTDLFKTVPTLQLASKGITLCQPITQSVNPLPKISDHIMGIDLGLKTLATCSIGTENQEMDRKFISFKNLFTTTVDPQTGRLIRIPQSMNPGSNIKRRVCSLWRTIGIQKSARDKTPNLSRKAFLDRQIDRSWRNMRNLHREIIQQTSHKIVYLSRAKQIGLIKFEDLRWSQHESKKTKGNWLAQNQINWFHGQIIDHVSQLAKRFGIKTVLVNANLSSKLDSELVRLTGLGRNIKKGEKLSDYTSLKGERKEKVYICIPDAQGYRKHIDADLNAARNIRMRVPLVV